MGKLSFNEKEYNYLVNSLTEGFTLMGQDAELLTIKTITKDVYRDPINTKYNAGVSVGLFFEDNPRPILKKYNWLTEDEELPYLAYLMPKDSELSEVIIEEYCIVKITSNFGLKTTRWFQIQYVRATSIDNLAWLCKLVPYRYHIDMIPETKVTDERLQEKTDTNYSILKRG